MKNAWWLDIGRLSIGVGVGLITYVVIAWVYIYIWLRIFIFYRQNSKMKWNFMVSHSSWQVPVYIAEITPKNHRGGFTSAQQVKLMPCRWSSIISNSLIFIPFFFLMCLVDVKSRLRPCIFHWKYYFLACFNSDW